MTTPKIGPGFYVLLFVAGFATFALHEGGHWLAATLLGHDAYYGLNSAGVRAQVPTDHRLLILAAGPAVTLVQAFLALALVMTRSSLRAFAFLWFAAFMRVMAMAVSLLNPNDEAQISDSLGLGLWTLPLIVSVVLVGLTWTATARLKLSWKFHVVCWIVASAALAAIVGLDMAL